MVFAADARVAKSVHECGSRGTKSKGISLTVSRKEYIIKVIKFLERSAVLIKCITEAFRNDTESVKDVAFL